MRRALVVTALVMLACAFAQSAFGFGPVAGSPFQAGRFADSVAFSPGGGLLAATGGSVLGFETNKVLVFSVDQATGALSQVPGSPFPTGVEADSVAFSPCGGLLAIVNRGDSTVSVFSVDQASGAVRQVLGSPFPTGADPVSDAFSPGGRLLAIVSSSALSVFSVNPRRVRPGAGLAIPDRKQPRVGCVHVGGVRCGGEAARGQRLGGQHGVDIRGRPGHRRATPGVGLSVCDGIWDAVVAFSQRGRLLATANESSSTASVFSVNEATGALRQVPGSPFLTGSQPVPQGFGSQPRAVAFSPGGRLLAVADWTTGNVTVFSTAVLPSNQFTTDNVHTHPDGTVTFDITVPSPGSVGVLETARRFVFARTHTSVQPGTTTEIRANPNAHGRRLVHHHTSPLTLRLHVTYTPAGGRPHIIDIHGLHLDAVR